MSGAPNDIDRLAAAIAEAHPAERERAAELAMELFHVAIERGLTYSTTLIYVRDQPTRQLSGRDLLVWAHKYALVSGGVLGGTP